MTNNLGQGHVLTKRHDPKSCATCRRKQQIDAIAAHPLAVEVTPIAALDNLLSYFRNTDQDVIADAIKYGFMNFTEEFVRSAINYPPKDTK